MTLHRWCHGVRFCIELGSLNTASGPPSPQSCCPDIPVSFLMSDLGWQPVNTASTFLVVFAPSLPPKIGKMPLDNRVDIIGRSVVPGDSLVYGRDLCFFQPQFSENI